MRGQGEARARVVPAQSVGRRDIVREEGEGTGERGGAGGTGGRRGAVNDAWFVRRGRGSG